MLECGLDGLLEGGCCMGGLVYVFRWEGEKGEREGRGLTIREPGLWRCRGRWRALGSPFLGCEGRDRVEEYW